MTRKIIHLDLDAFFCAVEVQQNPALRGKPFAVGGRPDSRGVVASCSYAARQFGIHSAMPMARAVKLCPELIIVPSRHKIYSQISRQVMDLLHQFTPLVEQISIDEAFLDVTDLPGSAVALARRLQEQVRDELGLPCSLGVATNKLVAKIATDVGKASARTDDYPRSIQVVPPGREAEFLAPLPADALWGVGPKTAERLAELGIRTIGDIAAWPEEDLGRRFGKIGRDLWRRAHGVDERPIVTHREAKSVSQETTFSKDVSDGSALRKTLHRQAEQVGKRLRRSHLAGHTVKLKIRWPDFTTLSRQTTLSQATDDETVIYQVACQLFDRVWQSGQPVRLIGVGVSGLGPAVRQPTLWDLPSEREEKLDAAVRALRKRFGDDAIVRGSDLARAEAESEEW
jgi:DNA polymerase-4